MEQEEVCREAASHTITFLEAGRDAALLQLPLRSWRSDCFEPTQARPAISRPHYKLFLIM